MAVPSLNPRTPYGSSVTLKLTFVMPTSESASRTSMVRPCFAFGSGRMVLPAFGAYTGGLNVLDPAIVDMFANGMAVAVLGRSGVYPVAARQLRPD